MQNEVEKETFEIENKIDEIEDFLSNCQTRKFDSGKLIVPYDGLYDLLDALRNCIPEEIDRYRKVIDRRAKILAGAENDAKRIIEEANRKKDMLLEENNIVIEAKQKAKYIIEDAEAEAEIIRENAQAEADNNIAYATERANELYEGTTFYTRDKMDAIERMFDDMQLFITDGMRSFESQVNEQLSAIRQDRVELDRTTFEEVTNGGGYVGEYDDYEEPYDEPPMDDDMQDA